MTREEILAREVEATKAVLADRAHLGVDFKRQIVFLKDGRHVGAVAHPTAESKALAELYLYACMALVKPLGADTVVVSQDSWTRSMPIEEGFSEDGSDLPSRHLLDSGTKDCLMVYLADKSGQGGLMWSCTYTNFDGNLVWDAEVDSRQGAEGLVPETLKAALEDRLFKAKAKAETVEGVVEVLRAVGIEVAVGNIGPPPEGSPAGRSGGRVTPSAFPTRDPRGADPCSP